MGSTIFKTKKRRPPIPRLHCSEEYHRLSEMSLVYIVSLVLSISTCNLTPSLPTECEQTTSKLTKQVLRRAGTGDTDTKGSLYTCFMRAVTSPTFQPANQMTAFLTWMWNEHGGWPRQYSLIPNTIPNRETTLVGLIERREEKETIRERIGLGTWCHWSILPAE